MHNNLFLNRLIIYTNSGKIAYNEEFHKGINIIRGDNSSGKSTITHFIFYVLGGAFNDWVKEAKQCSYVLSEVELNGATIVLKRELNFSDKTKKANPQEPLYIYWGSLEELKNTEIEHEWHKYGYQTYPDKKSYSNVLFNTLNIPIVKGDNNITMHQLLRLIYVDQDSPTSSLFLYEQFDSSMTRETVSDLLLGVYNQDLYDSKQRKVEVEKELSGIKSEIKVIRKFTQNLHDLIPANIFTKIENKEKELNKIETELIVLKNNNKAVRFTKKTKLEFEELNKQVITQREKVNSIESNTRNLQFEIEDSKYFIESLSKKIKAINNSIITRDFLGEFPLEYCPECLSDIKMEDTSLCKLCKQEVDESYGITQARKIEQELSFQQKESISLLTKKERKLIDLKTSFESEKINLFQLQQKVNQSLKDVKSVRDEKIDKLLSDIGFIEGEIIQLRTLLENAELYQSLIQKETELGVEFEFLNFKINSLRSEQEKLKYSTNNKIEEKGLFLLNNDLRRQQDFAEAKEFNIDYRNNLAFISDKDAKYSASSNFYLKTAARFSIFLASLEIEKMRYPRFIFCDNMEDKGIEKERAQNFQKIIIKQAEKSNKENFQLIYTTSFIPEDLDNTSYCVGDSYTEDNPSLKIK
ncbi:AAA family ATPase [Aureivirga sp. CE67]|uniref:AAA family ATPase n=1 Tax=Aureivirga sp. CE67 TaxID=1788983 RepID=UPI001E4FB34F|nr:AAA family ATPase [Aureivirga sp. CE67]